MFLLSITVHEFAHALLANRLGDDTAKSRGRLTLNPFKHADIIGTLIMPLASFASGFALIGWAKPVPIDRRKFKNQLRDDAVVSFAGPFANLLLAVLFFIFFHFCFRKRKLALFCRSCCGMVYSLMFFFLRSIFFQFRLLMAPTFYLMFFRIK